ncbi:xanthine dehydrogenase family protein molybdopterin-binding subunit [Spirosoma validum]|uniref:Xanthine dehydrogenase family protein molybdopterin-binding subunit n=1 Tax=Spirosoma validum TaxID=2771355 RepID=A0A927B7P7_9BACT|nr:molybdopterin cofactor-binding domain-containing protein [Spirosoma validum]MBD2756722.1 xanthine dehydrogenase family protein molybdopterin-binding subunit [Spirosoma validum]
MTSKPLSRRDFFQYAGLTGSAFLLGLSSSIGRAATSQLPTGALAEPLQFTPYIRIDSTGAITIFNTKPEMGQGTFQSIPALICEELEVPLEMVTIKQSNGEKELGTLQRAGSSASIRTSFTELRKVGASAKEMLVKAASTRWGVDVASCRASAGTVVHVPTKRVLTYGELAQEATKLEIPKEPKLKDRKDFTIIGKPGERPDVPLKTCGKAEFGIDVEVPGMLYATVERCPVIGGTLKSFDASQALKIPGVVNVVDVERVVGRFHLKGVAVVANSYWTAMQARKKLVIEWDTKGFETFNSSDYENKLRSLANTEGLPDKSIGSVDTLNLSPQNTIEAFYETPMVAHHALEPISCVAHVQGDKVEIWTSTQVPSSVTGSGPNDLHKHVGFKPENIKMHTTFLGGGFGRRLYIDFIIEAVNLAKQIDKPVKVMWSREDTTLQGPFRPMTFSQLKGGLSDDGKLVAFQHKVISPSYLESVNTTFDNTKPDPIMVEGIGEQAYEIPNLKTSYVRTDYHVPLGAWRSVTSSTVAFAHECFIDELAHKAKKDPLAFRLEMLSKPTDVQRVLRKLKVVSDWDKPLPKGKGRGVAQWEFFAGLCAQVVEVTYRPDKSIKIDKVIAVIDLGEVVNPDNVRNQVEGAIIMGIGAAVKPGITLVNGKVMQSNFYDNPLIRINEVPEIEVHILAEGGKVKGVGEPGLPALAPALANAIFAATGKRFRKMPFSLEAV